METLRLYRTRRHYLRQLGNVALIGIFVSIVIFFGWKRFPGVTMWEYANGWLSAAILVSLLIPSISGLIRPKLTLILSDEGIEYLPAKMGSVAWKDISNVYIQEQSLPFGNKKTRWLCFESNDPSAILSRLGKHRSAFVKYGAAVGRGMGFSPKIVLLINENGAPMQIEELERSVAAYRQTGTR